MEEVFGDGARWSVGDFTLGEMKQLDDGWWLELEFVGERVCTLA